MTSFSNKYTFPQHKYTIAHKDIQTHCLHLALIASLLPPLCPFARFIAHNCSFSGGTAPPRITHDFILIVLKTPDELICLLIPELICSLTHVVMKWIKKFRVDGSKKSTGCVVSMFVKQRPPFDLLSLGLQTENSINCFARIHVISQRIDRFCSATTHFLRVLVYLLSMHVLCHIWRREWPVPLEKGAEWHIKNWTKLVTCFSEHLLGENSLKFSSG